MSGFNRITEERYLEIKEEARKLAEEAKDKDEKSVIVDEHKKDFKSEDERIVFIGNLYFPDDDEFLNDYNLYNRNIKLMADNYNVDTYIVRCKVLEMSMFKDSSSSSSQYKSTYSYTDTKEDTVSDDLVEEKQEDSFEKYSYGLEDLSSYVKQKEEEVISDFDDMTDSFLDESSAKVSEISERNVEIETLQKSLIESIRVAKVNVSRKSEEINSERDILNKEKKEFEEYKSKELEKISNEREHLHKEEERLLALKNKIMDTIKTFEEAKASLANVFSNKD